MTAARVEAAILELTAGLATIVEGAKNLKESTSAQDDALRDGIEKLDGRITDLGQRLADHSTAVELIKKDIGDIKRISEEGRKNRWALGLAILSAILSLATAIIVSLVKRP